MSAPGQYAGMTTNERLFAAGLLAAFDAAAASEDREALLGMLTQVGLADQAASLAAAAIDRARPVAE